MGSLKTGGIMVPAGLFYSLGWHSEQAVGPLLWIDASADRYEFSMALFCCLMVL
jgi:hypothetical protein